MSATHSGSRDRFALVVIAVLALVLRLAAWVSLRESVLLSQLRLDEAAFWDWARGEVGRFHNGVPYVLSPVMPWLLEGLGQDGVRLLSVLSSTVAVVLAADLARRHGGVLAGWATGILLSLAWPLLLAATAVHEASVLALTVMAALWFVARPGASMRAWSAGALLVGVAIVLRPSMAVLLALWLLGGGRWGTGLPRHWRGVVLLIALAPSLAIGVRNTVVAGEFLPIPANAGIHARAGADPAYPGDSAAPRGVEPRWAARWQADRAHVPEGTVATPSEVGREHFMAGVRNAVTHPLGWIGLQGRKLRNLVSDVSRGDGLNPEYWRRESPLLALPLLPSMGLVMALGLVGLWISRRRDELGALRWWVGGLVLAILLAFVDERMRLPLYAPLGVFAGIALARAWSERSVRMAVGVGLLFALFAADRLVAPEARADEDFRSHLQHAEMLREAGRLEEAAAKAQAALEFGRTQEDSARRARVELVRTLFELGRFEEADQHLKTLEHSFPHDHDVLALRGRWHLRHGKPTAAFPLFERVLDEDPDHVDALLGIGWCRIESKAHVRAEQDFRRVLVLAGPNAEAWAGLGVIEAHGKRSHETARRHFEHALRLNWRTPIAHQFIGDYYRTIDEDIDAAMYHYRQCLLQDPLNLTVRRFLIRARIDIDRLLADEDLPRPQPR